MASFIVYNDIHVPNQDPSNLKPAQSGGRFTQTDQEWLKQEIDKRKLTFMGFKDDVMLFIGKDGQQDFNRVRFAFFIDPKNGVNNNKIFTERAICACPDGRDYGTGLKNLWTQKFTINSHYYQKYIESEKSVVSSFSKELFMSAQENHHMESRSVQENEQALDIDWSSLNSEWGDRFAEKGLDVVSISFLEDAKLHLQEYGVNEKSLNDIIQAKR